MHIEYFFFLLRNVADNTFVLLLKRLGSCAMLPCSHGVGVLLYHRPHTVCSLPHPWCFYLETNKLSVVKMDIKLM